MTIALALALGTGPQPALAASTDGPSDSPSPRNQPPAQVAISPDRFEIDIDEPNNASFRVTNLGDSDLEVQVSVENWILDESNRAQVVPPTEQSLDQWIVVNPLRFTVPAGKSQTVRFSIRPRTRPEQGEHRGMIFLEQILPEPTQSSGVRIKFKYGVAVYGYSGELFRQGEIVQQSVVFDGRNTHLVLEVESTGNAHVRLGGEWTLNAIRSHEPEGSTDAAGGTVSTSNSTTTLQPLRSGELPPRPVLPGFRRAISVPLASALDEGEYVVSYQASLGQGRREGSIRFRVSSDAAILIESLNR